PVRPQPGRRAGFSCPQLSVLSATKGSAAGRYCLQDLLQRRTQTRQRLLRLRLRLHHPRRVGAHGGECGRLGSGDSFFPPDHGRPQPGEPFCQYRQDPRADVGDKTIIYQGKIQQAAAAGAKGCNRFPESAWEYGWGAGAEGAAGITGAGAWAGHELPAGGNAGGAGARFGLLSLVSATYTASL